MLAHVAAHDTQLLLLTRIACHDRTSIRTVPCHEATPGCGGFSTGALDSSGSFAGVPVVPNERKALMPMKLSAGYSPRSSTTLLLAPAALIAAGIKQIHHE